jgi:hypothetical protein
MGEVRGAYNILVGRPEGRRPLGRPRRRWEDIKMDFREIRSGDVDWILWAQDRDTLLHGVSYVKMRQLCEVAELGGTLCMYIHIYYIYVYIYINLVGLRLSQWVPS